MLNKIWLKVIWLLKIPIILSNDVCIWIKLDIVRVDVGWVTSTIHELLLRQSGFQTRPLSSPCAYGYMDNNQIKFISSARVLLHMHTSCLPSDIFRARLLGSRQPGLAVVSERQASISDRCRPKKTSLRSQPHPDPHRSTKGKLNNVQNHASSYSLDMFN